MSECQKEKGEGPRSDGLVYLLIILLFLPQGNPPCEGWESHSNIGGKDQFPNLY
jgi:hypothetical protein